MADRLPWFICEVLFTTFFFVEMLLRINQLNWASGLDQSDVGGQRTSDGVCKRGREQREFSEPCEPRNTSWTLGTSSTIAWSCSVWQTSNLGRPLVILRPFQVLAWQIQVWLWMSHAAPQILCIFASSLSAREFLWVLRGLVLASSLQNCSKFVGVDCNVE